MSRSLAIAFALALVASSAHARPQPRFEPTDLELEQPGVTELDLQLGPVRGPGAWRLVTPDFELDLGLTSRVELDLDGAYAFEGVTPGSPGSTLFDHTAPDNLWLSAKLGLADWRDPVRDRAIALGLQIGPKLPVANGASGLGFESQVLLGATWGGSHLVLDLGALYDPSVAGARPRGLEAGIDLQLELVPDRWAILGEIGGVHYLSSDADQLSATAGLQFSPTPMLDLSVVALVGVLSGSDPYGVLFGISPKLAVW